MSCNCNGDDGTETIHVYVELAGNEDYHSSLKGRDEADQHPISAITNLSTTLEDINTTLAQHGEAITENNEFILNQLNELASSLTGVSNELHNTETNLSQNYYTKTEIDNAIDHVMRYKGSVTNMEDLPVVNTIGDVWNVVSSGANYVWTGTGWDNLSPYLNLDAYATKDYVDGTKDATVDLIKEHIQLGYYNKVQIDDMFAEFDPSIQNNCLMFKGNVATYDDLPATADTGSTYKVFDTGEKYFWNGFGWEPFNGIIDKVYTKTETDNLLNYKADEDFVEESVNSLQDQIDANKEALLEVQMNQEWQRIQDVIDNN